MYAGPRALVQPDHLGCVAGWIGVEFGHAVLQRAVVLADTHSYAVHNGSHQEGACLAA